MGLSTRFLLSKDHTGDDLPEFIKSMNLEVLRDLGEINAPTGIMANDEIAIGNHNGYIVLHHSEIPMAMIHGEYAGRTYDHAYHRLQKTTENMLAVIFQSSINGFGYGIHRNKKQVRTLLGDYRGIAFEGNFGEIQEEEQLLKSGMQENGKVLYRDKEYAIHELGTELTENVLSNFYGGDIFSESIRLRKFKVKYHMMRFY
jgi:hypothetical protein